MIKFDHQSQVFLNRTIALSITVDTSTRKQARLQGLVPCQIIYSHFVYLTEDPGGMPPDKDNDSGRVRLSWVKRKQFDMVSKEQE